MMKLRHTPLSIAAGPIWLEALLAHSPDAAGLILIAQNSVGNHRDSREAHFAKRLQEAGYATLIFDLLTRHEEARDPDTRYNTPLLGQRISALFEWLRHQPPLVPLPVGLVASSTGSAAAIRAIAKEPTMVSALVCRGGRPGLAGMSPLQQVACPTRMIVGEKDDGLTHVRQAYEQLTCQKDWRVVAGTDDLFREPGALDTTATQAAEWFQRHLAHVPVTVGTDDSASTR
ncbi:MAG: dienelactone hydrolase family protein [Zoogloea oleivorans]|jgi:dienelactone hydrolase|uniref:dienelactone hydrolase family protein n=1 Tax=Zoogloea oleivorans TaxID=1552750 RepID=UPI002A36FA0C|nr:dienelactone hydrolase family protein [Zoogloea oleivorans]MDY0034545.1 dienelactone hydrolase family protein [Zoogloea oleivorans]